MYAYLHTAGPKLRDHHDLPLLCGVLDCSLHLFLYGHTGPMDRVEGLFITLVEVLAVPIQPKPIAAGGAEDGGEGDTFAQALRVKQLICHVLEQILNVRLRVRMAHFLQLVQQNQASHKEQASVVERLQATTRPAVPPPCFRRHVPPPRPAVSPPQFLAPCHAPRFVPVLPPPRATAPLPPPRATPRITAPVVPPPRAAGAPRRLGKVSPPGDAPHPGESPRVTGM